MKRQHRLPFRWLLGLLSLLATVGLACAGTPDRMRFHKLVQHSSVIARLRCVGARLSLEDGENWTDTTFQLVLSVKGYLPRFIVVRTPGGAFQNVNTGLDGVPKFRKGEEVFLFLRGRPGRPFHIVALAQGTFRIRKDVRTGAEFVTPDSGNVPIFDCAINEIAETEASKQRVDMFLETILREIRRQSL